MRKAALALVMVVSGCSLLPGGGGETPRPVRLTVVAGERLNPDDEGRSLPTAVRVLQVGSTAKASAAEMLDLVRDPKATLGDDLLGVEELQVQPGERIERTLAREKGARALLVVGLFRRPTGLAWRQLVELPAEGREATLTLAIDEYRIERR
jgi:type VI secretion system protein VasD